MVLYHYAYFHQTTKESARMKVVVEQAVSIKIESAIITCILVMSFPQGLSIFMSKQTKKLQVSNKYYLPTYYMPQRLNSMAK